VRLVTYTFALKKYVYMYNHALTCTDGQTSYSCLAEAAPTREETILFWPDDLGLSAQETEVVIRDLAAWASEQSFKYEIFRGPRCVTAGGAG
jgi:hypothetical protein